MVFFITFLFLCVLVGVFQREKVSSFERFTLSRGTFSSFAIICTITASFTGGGSIFGTIEKSYTTGFYALCAICGFFVQLLLVAYIASRSPKSYNHAMTLGDIFDHHYGSWLKKIIALLWVCFGFGILSIQIKVMGSIFAGYSGLSLLTCTLLGGAFLLAYCTLGGIRAVIYTDVIQLITMFIILPFCLIYIVFTKVGVDPFLAAITIAITEQPKSWDMYALGSAFIGFVAGDAFIPPVVQRFLMAKNQKQIVKTFSMGAFGFLFLVICASCIGIALAQLPHIKFGNSTSSFIHVFDDWLQPFVAIGFFAVVISSADSYLNALVTTVTKDLFNSSSVKLCHILTLVTGGASLLCAVFLNNFFDILLFLFKFWGPIIVVPLSGLIMGKYIKDNHLKVCLAISALTLILWNVFSLEVKTGMSDVLVGLVISLIVFLTFYRQEKKFLLAS